jgi:hypothetical protein
MSQSIFGLGLGGSGIVAVLIIAGIILYSFGMPQANTALVAGIGIGSVLGVLGIFGVLITLAKRIM